MNSINMSRAQGLEESFLFPSNNGVVDMFIRVSEYPAVGEFSSILLHGGDSAGNQIMWGINSSGALVYQRGSGMATPRVASSSTFSRGAFEHVAFALDSGDVHVWVNGTKELDSAVGYTDTFATSSGFSLGASSSRTFGGTDWKVTAGNLDEIHFRAGSVSTLVGDSDFTVPTSANDSGSNTITLEHADGTPATATAAIDATTGSVTGLTLLTPGFLYSEEPSPIFSAPDSGGNFIIGEVVSQVNSTYTMKGEVTDWSDSDRVLQLAHCGSTDGEYRQFNVNRPISGANASWIPSLVEELQEIQQESQNKIFDDFEGDFLDFSESNPFGDME
jgi:hypothetical protein